MDETMSDAVAATVRRGTLQRTEAGYELTIGRSRLTLGHDYGDGAPTGDPSEWVGYLWEVHELDGDVWNLVDMGGALTGTDLRAVIAQFHLDSIALEAGIAVGDVVLIPYMGAKLQIRVSEINLMARTGKLQVRGLPDGGHVEFTATSWERA